MEKNGIYRGKVSGQGTEGEGILEYEGATVFVPFCLAGEEIEFKVLKIKGNIAYGKLQRVIVPSPERVTPPCSVFYKCGGCSLQHMSYGAQAEFKRNSLARALSKIGGIETNIQPTVCGREYRYRNKLVLPIGEKDGGGVAVGFYAPHSHRIVEITDCLIQAEWVKKIISAVKKFAGKCNLKGYNEESGKGVLRRIAVREIKGKFIVALVVTRDINCDYLIELLKEGLSGFTLLLNINPSRGNAVFGDKWRTLYGDGFFEAEDCGVKYKAGANTFLQVNDDVRAKLYERVLREAEEIDVAVDLYSGGGMLTAMLAKKCKKAYGIEIVEEASRCADELKILNGLENKIINICGDVAASVEEVLDKTRSERRLVICDPPRKGMERSVVKAVARSGAEKVVLISCNPATLARDLGILTGTLIEREGELVKASACAAAAENRERTGNYEIISVTPFDMFPQTPHVETLVVLSKKIPDSHIDTAYITEVKCDLG